jgi:hypothetical protein
MATDLRTISGDFIFVFYLVLLLLTAQHYLMLLFIPFTVRALTLGTLGSAVLFYLMWVLAMKLSHKDAKPGDTETAPSNTRQYTFAGIGALFPLMLMGFKHNDPVAVFLFISIITGSIALPIVVGNGLFAILRRSDITNDGTSLKPVRPLLYILSVVTGMYTLGLNLFILGSTNSGTDYLIYSGILLLTAVITIIAARKTPATSAYDLIPEMATRPASTTVADELAKLHALKEKGGLTDEEYEQQKKKLLYK